MHKIKPAAIGFVASVYVSLIFVLVNAFLSSNETDNEQLLEAMTLFILPVFIVIGVFMALFAIIALFVNAKKMHYDAKMLQEINELTLVIKLSLIPFFIVNFMICIFAFTFMFIFTFYLIPFAIFFTYCIIVPGSIFAVSVIYTQYKQRMITAEQFVFHVILQLIPVLDVIGYVLLYHGIKEKLKRIEVYPQ